MSPRAQSAFPPPAIPASHAHLFHRRSASSSAVANSPPSHGGYFAAAAVLRRGEGARTAKEEVGEGEGIVPRSGQSDDGSVGSRDTPGPETPYEDLTAVDAVRRRSSASSTTSGQIPRGRDLPILSIPPFRGRKNESHAYSSLSVSVSVAEEKDDLPRRSSGPSVFMIPAPAPIAKPMSTPVSTATGLGIDSYAPVQSLNGAGDAVSRATETAGGSSVTKRSLESTDGGRTAPQKGASTDLSDSRMRESPGASAAESSNCRRSSSPAQTRTSPPSKRPRTRLSPLDSLATTASDILSSQTDPQPVSMAPSRGAMSLASLISHPATVTPRFEHYNDTRATTRDIDLSHRPEPDQAFSARSNLRNSRHRLDECRQEIGDPPSGTPLNASSSAAETGMAAQAHSATVGASSMQSAVASEVDTLGKRRGHRPPAVATQSHPRPTSRPSSSANGPNEALMRASLGTIPSVLVGGAMEAEYAAQMSRERDIPQPRARPVSAGHQLDGISDGSGSASVVATNRYPQPPLVSSSTYYIRPGQPFTSTQHSHHHKAASFSAAETQGPRGSISAPVPSSLPRHLLNAHRPGADPPAPPPPRPPSSSGPSILQTPYSMAPPSGYTFAPDRAQPDREPDAVPAAGGLPPGPASKQAFLSFFSGFYDTLADSRALSTTLDHQVQRAGALLQTLQSAESALEALVDQRIDACRRDWDSRWRHVDQRLRRLEERANLGRHNADGGALEDRLGRLEETFARRHSESDSAGGESARRHSSSVSQSDPSRFDGRLLR